MWTAGSVRVTALFGAVETMIDAVVISPVASSQMPTTVNLAEMGLVMIVISLAEWANGTLPVESVAVRMKGLCPKACTPSDQLRAV
jgi:hypothetical protein